MANLLARRLFFIASLLLLEQGHGSLNFDVQDPNTLSFNAGQNNQVRRFANIQVVKPNSNTYQIIIDGGIRSTQAEALIVNNQLADIKVAPKVVTISDAKLMEDQSIELELEISSVPNPVPSGGYYVYLQAQSTQFNLLNESKDYFKFQTNAVGAVQNKLLYFDILEPDGKTMVASWFTEQESTLLTPNWSDDKLIRVNNSHGSRAQQTRKFVIKFEYEFLNQLPLGSFLFRVLMGMDPYSQPSLLEEITSYEEIVDQQLSFFNALLRGMQGSLQNQNFVIRLNSTQIDQIRTNELKLLKDYEQFLKDVQTAYETLLKRNNLTASEIVDLNERINSIVEKKEEIQSIQQQL